MRLRGKVLALTGAAATVALGGVWLGVGSAEAYTGWRPHPTITSDWHCGKTADGKVFSVQVCVIAPHPTTRQAVMIVRNRSGSLRAIGATKVNMVVYAPTKTYSNWVTCPASAVGANDYSVCFGYGPIDLASPVASQGETKDGVTGELIRPLPSPTL